MIEKMFKNTEGGNCTIADLKAQLGQARKRLEEIEKRLKKNKDTEEEANPMPESFKGNCVNGANCA